MKSRITISVIVEINTTDDVSQACLEQIAIECVNLESSNLKGASVDCGGYDAEAISKFVRVNL